MLTLDQAELAAWPMDHHNERARALLIATKVSEVLTGRDGRPRQSLNLLDVIGITILSKVGNVTVTRIALRFVA